METTLKDLKYDFITHDDKTFIIRFDAEMEKLGYTSGGIIGNGYCWGRHMVIFRKSGGKDKQDGICKFRKTYTLEGREISKCNGLTFEFWEPDMAKLPNYIELLRTFFPGRK